MTADRLKAIFLLATLDPIVITGEEDGEQHITGNIANFFLSMGVTLPVQCNIPGSN